MRLGNNDPARDNVSFNYFVNVMQRKIPTNFLTSDADFPHKDAFVTWLADRPL